MSVLIAGAFGAFGGLIRGGVGALKALSINRRFAWEYWVISVAIAILMGMLAGVVFDYSTKISVLAGYAGTDAIEGILKIFKGPRQLFSPGAKR